MNNASGTKSKRHSITAIVSKEEKEQIEQEAHKRGRSQQDIVRERVFGRVPKQVSDNAAAVREIISTCHALKHAAQRGRASDQQVKALTAAARDLLAAMVRS